jgi:hypothetical protein
MNHSIACVTTGTVPVKSSEIFLGRIKGISAPWDLAILAISALSVLTIILSKHLLLIAASIDQAIIGFPQSFYFFLGYVCCHHGQV